MESLMSSWTIAVSVSMASPAQTQQAQSNASTAIKLDPTVLMAIP
jgi:hypothetical protein